MPPLIVIVGETASGKSALAIEIAKRFDGEIICADSRTVYSEFDIGSAKPSNLERAEVPHHPGDPQARPLLRARRPMRFLHLSDVHVTADYRRHSLVRLGWRRWLALGELTFGGRARAFARAPETITRILEDARTLEVDHVILSGDVTAYALPAEFDGARAAMGQWA